MRVEFVLLAGAVCLTGFARAADESAVDYATQIKPLLTKHCIQCHGAESQKSGLRLDTAAAALQGGDSGAAVEPGEPDASLIIQAVLGKDGVARMPPKGDPLTADEIALLTAWVKAGAKAPADETAPAARPAVQSTHWAFQPIRQVAPPAVADPAWCRTPIDNFIAAKLAEHELVPSAEADRATLIRRLSLDLLGLPPSPEEVAEFAADADPQAYERLVDRLLASPHYGERWGRHWLDLARYADSNGYTRDMGRNIWKYREWVIAALNRDLPFDEFVIEQLAGDMLPGATLAQRVATGFHRNTLINEEGGTDPEQFRVEAVVDRTNTTGTVFLGLTIGCAQCHNHKYDPISQRDYYQLYAFLNNAEFDPKDPYAPKMDVPSDAEIAAGAPQKQAELRAQVAKLEAEFKALEADFAKDREAWVAGLNEEGKKALPFNVLNAVNLPERDRSEQHKRDLDAHYRSLPAAREKYPLLEQIAQCKAAEPKFPDTMIILERAEPRETHIQVRGDFLRLGAKVEPNVPAVLPPLPAGLAAPNRLDLARWLVDPRQPLTSRVAVNRIWQRYFGRGLVETENDFGVQGAAPTHPELLDWLAAEFQVGWSQKRLHKLIVTSAVYRQASHERSDLTARDPRNLWLGRQARLRLDAEIIRDAALGASGLLSERIGGPSVYPPQPEGVFDFTQDKKPWKTAEDEDRYRRAMYTYLWRSSPYPAMSVFDFPDANVTCTRRMRSNTPLQSLTLANDLTFVEFARGLARRVLAPPDLTDEARLRRAFQLCLTREPSAAETARLHALLADQRTAYAAAPDAARTLAPGAADPVEGAAWTMVSRVLMNLDEFITRE